MGEFMNTATISLVISIVSIGLSAGTFWWTGLRRGSLKITRPSIVFFGYDGSNAKVFLRCLLYSSSARGQLIEHMFVRIAGPQSERLFTFWGYGETKALSAGSGLFVSQTGIALNHHFVSSVHDEPYLFAAGCYTIEVMAKVIPRRRPITLQNIAIELTDDQAFSLADRKGILFERDPIAGTFKGQAGPDPTDQLAVEVDRVMGEIRMAEWARTGGNS
jgi:hypothetical protein